MSGEDDDSRTFGILFKMDNVAHMYNIKIIRTQIRITNNFPKIRSRSKISK